MNTPVDYRTLGPGHYSLLVDGKSYEVFVRPEKEGHSVEVNGHLIFIPGDGGVTKPTRGQEGSAEIFSPMPGRVISLKKNEGEEVRAEEGVLVISAMKMENEIVAPRSGRVRFFVKVGDTVEGGQLLVRIE